METDKSPAVWTTKRETRLRFKGNHLKKHKSHNDNSVLRSTTNNQRETNRSLITDWRHFKETPVKLSVWVETWNWQEVSVKTNRGTKIQLVCLEAESKRLQSASVGRDKTRRQKRAGCFQHLTERTTLRTSQNNQSSFYRRVGPTHINTHRHTPTHSDTHKHTPTHTNQTSCETESDDRCSYYQSNLTKLYSLQDHFHTGCTR